MTKEEVIAMAREAGFMLRSESVDGESDWWECFDEEIESFAKLLRNDYSNKHAQLWLKRIDEAVLAEREACAKAAGPEDSYRDEWFNAKADSVKHILARRNT